MKKRGMTMGEILVVVAIIGVLAALFIPVLVNTKKRSEELRASAEAKDKEDKEAEALHNQQYEAAHKVDWVTIGVGYYDHADYMSNGHQLTVIYFNDGRTVPMNAIIAMSYQKGSKIQIQQMRFGAGTPSESLANQYKVETAAFDAEAK